MIPRTPTAVLLDRDGVINEPVLDPRSGVAESPYAPEDVQLVAGAAEAIKQIQSHGIPIAVVSNQPAAAKGTHTLEELESVDRRIRELLADRGVTIAVWRFCHHHPAGSHPELGGDCDCRKPKPGLLLQALDALGVPVSPDVVIVGDSDADIGAGRSLSISTILVEHPETTHRRGVFKPDLRVESAAQWANVLVSND
jgi:D-glycero-D-manno-heptose 1,7-bisphosphate phosphatase